MNVWNIARLRTSIRLLLVLLSAGLGIVALHGAAVANAEKDKAAIKAAWETYQQHIDARKGDEAAALLAKPTIAYYERMKLLTLTAEQQVLAKEGVLMRLSVYMMRHLVTADELKGMNARQFVSWSVKRGMVGNSTRGKVELVNIVVDGDKAVSSIKVGTSTSPPLFRFLREGGVWKIDAVEAIRKMEPIMEKRLKAAGIKEEKILQIMIRKHSKKPYKLADLQKPLIAK